MLKVLLTGSILIFHSVTEDMPWHSDIQFLSYSSRYHRDHLSHAPLEHLGQSKRAFSLVNLQWREL